MNNLCLLTNFRQVSGRASLMQVIMFSGSDCRLRLRIGEYFFITHPYGLRLQIKSGWENNLLRTFM